MELRLVKEEDAEFILSLRLDNKLNKYLSKVENNIEKQKEWIRNYKEKEKKGQEFYYIIEEDKVRYGTVRIYNIREDKCTWGSFVIKPERPKGVTIEAINKSFEICFNNLRIKRVEIDVRKENKKAIKLYEFIGFCKYEETVENFLYFIDKDKIKIKGEKNE